MAAYYQVEYSKLKRPTQHQSAPVFSGATRYLQHGQWSHSALRSPTRQQRQPRLPRFSTVVHRSSSSSSRSYRDPLVCFFRCAVQRCPIKMKIRVPDVFFLVLFLRSLAFSFFFFFLFLVVFSRSLFPYGFQMANFQDNLCLATHKTMF